MTNRAKADLKKRRRSCSSTTMLDEHGAAKHLGLSVATLRYWRWARRGPEYVKLCAAVRYDVRVLDAWLAKCRVIPAGSVQLGLPEQQR